MLTPLHVGEGAVVGVLEGRAVVLEDHVVGHRGQDIGHQGLAHLASVPIAVAVEELVEAGDASGLSFTRVQRQQLQRIDQERAC